MLTSSENARLPLGQQITKVLVNGENVTTRCTAIELDTVPNYVVLLVLEDNDRIATNPDGSVKTRIVHGRITVERDPNPKAVPNLLSNPSPEAL